MAELFIKDDNIFRWTDVETFLIRSQFNEMLFSIINEYDIQYPFTKPSFLNKNNCLTLERCRDSRILLNALLEKQNVLNSTTAFKDADNKQKEAKNKRDDAKAKFEQTLGAYQKALKNKQAKADDSADSSFTALEIALNESRQELDKAETDSLGAIF